MATLAALSNVERLRSPRHLYLRSVTARAHVEVEKAVDLAGFFADVGRYRDYLRRLHLFHEHLKPVVDVASAATRGFWRLDEHLSSLSSVLLALGTAPLRAPLPWFRKVTVDDPASALGALYVLVGSALGARVLVRQAQALPLPEGQGHRYLSSLAETTSWSAFLALLDREEITSEARLGAGAIATFESILDVFTRSMDV